MPTVDSRKAKLRISKFVPLPPDPSLPEILTKSEYPLPSAVAELVDNSIDSGAEQIVVRLGRTSNRLDSLQVLDDGSGIEQKIFDKIMRFGFKSPHKKSDIGMYGVGLKTSSLSQAGRLWVVSKVRGKSPIPLIEQIQLELALNASQSARSIAKSLNASKYEVNSTLYRNIEMFEKEGTSPPLWTNKP